LGVSLVAAATAPARTNPTAGADAAVTVHLLKTFRIVSGSRRVVLPRGVQRLVAFVAVQNRPVLRVHAAGSLWTNTSERRAAANLRSALWRLKRCEHAILEADPSELRLARGVSVDLHVAEALAKQLLARGDADGADADPSLLANDLLPDWYDDWVLLERERFRQIRLQALETLCDRFSAAGRMNEALAAGLAALEAEPLRESAHRALVRVHLAQGNAIEAIRQYRFYCRLLRRLQISPSEQMEALVAGLGQRRNAR
jgi:DNA-binding SARP family transcriptional activator